MRYLSVCSGIEAASCAWHPLGWTAVAFSEIEKFPSAVLAHHYPGVPNWGDMTKFQEWPDADVDVLVGGTPCQSFSVAGLRKGLADPRGNLALTYLAIADKYRPEWLVWENVPGVLSSGGGRDFGSFLGGLGELGYGWAYRVLDAQYFGLAQRRKRVFVVASLGGWQRAAAVLFDSASLRGDSAPSRAPGQSPTASLRTRAPGSGGQGTDWEHTVAHALAARAGSALCAPDIQTFLPVVTGTLGSRTTAGGGLGGDFECAGGVIPQKWPAEIAATLNAHYGDKWGLEDQHALGGASLFVPVVGALTAKGPTAMGAPEVDAGHYIVSSGQANASITRDIAPALDCLHEAPIIAHSLRAEGFDASDDGTGRGTPLVAMPQVSGPILSHRRGVPSSDEVAQGHLVAQTLTSGGTGARGHLDPVNTTLIAEPLAFDTTQMTSATNYSNPKAGDPCHPLASGAHPPAVAFDARQSDVLQYGEKTGPLDTDGHTMGIQAGMAVRRLTPRECERLQGFPDDYTLTPYRGKPAADGPRYKALGNSMAVPVMHWIGKRIQQVQDISKKELA